jgi:hypothetical protein
VAPTSAASASRAAIGRTSGSGWTPPPTSPSPPCSAVCATGGRPRSPRAPTRAAPGHSVQRSAGDGNRDSPGAAPRGRRSHSRRSWVRFKSAARSNPLQNRVSGQSTSAEPLGYPAVVGGVGDETPSIPETRAAAPARRVCCMHGNAQLWLGLGDASTPRPSRVCWRDRAGSLRRPHSWRTGAPLVSSGSDGCSCSPPIASVSLPRDSRDSNVVHSVVNSPTRETLAKGRTRGSVRRAAEDERDLAVPEHRRSPSARSSARSTSRSSSPSAASGGGRRPSGRSPERLAHLRDDLVGRGRQGPIR